MRTLKNKKILITGGAGFIGSHLAERLLIKDAQITICDNNELDIKGVKFVKSDLSDYLKKSKLSFDYIFHLAGNSSIASSIQDPLFDYEKNVRSTILLLENLRKLQIKPLLIYASSAAVYGIPQNIPISENDPVLPISPYGISKLSAERYIAFFVREHDIKATILRFFSVYGPGQKKQTIFNLSKKIRDGEKIEIDPRQSRDYIYIDDLIKAMILVAKNCLGEGEVYNIATGKPRTLKEVVETIERVWAIKPVVEFKKSATPLYIEKVNISKIKKLGFKPEVEFENGIKKIKEWFEAGSENV